jgi:hypothetical protein
MGRHLSGFISNRPTGIFGFYISMGRLFDFSACSLLVAYKRRREREREKERAAFVYISSPLWVGFSWLLLLRRSSHIRPRVATGRVSRGGRPSTAFPVVVLQALIRGVNHELQPTEYTM